MSCIWVHNEALQPVVEICQVLTLIILSVCLNLLSPDSVENEISLYIITTCSNIQVMRIKKVITNDEMS